MKEKIIIFVGGLLLGAIISTGSIFIYTVANKDNNDNNRTSEMGMPNGNPPSMPNGQNSGGEPPAMPSNS